MNELEQGRWLTLAEIASRTGRHIDAVRSWAYRGRRSERLRTQKNNRHELQVWFTPELVPELAQGVALAASFLGSGSDEGANEAMAELRSRMEDLTEALTEARIRQARAEGELAAEARRSTDLMAALEREREERAKLSAELAEARKGWLERLLEAVRR
jgi:chromosome segregation ATPase